MMHHKKIEKWLQPGGHADGDTDLVSVARKECEEETGVSVGNPVHWQETNILDIDIHEIPPRKGEPAHLHFDVRYLFLRSTEAVPRKNSESNAVKWVDCTDLESITSEESILRPVRKILQGGWR